MPTKSQWEELITKCKWEETTLNNYKGWKITGPSGQSIFLPAAAWYLGSLGKCNPGTLKYWTSTLSDEYTFNAYALDSPTSIEDHSVQYGLPIRPVLSELANRLINLRAAEESIKTIVSDEAENSVPTFRIR